MDEIDTKVRNIVSVCNFKATEMDFKLYII